jgi:hypothetical protein
MPDAPERAGTSSRWESNWPDRDDSGDGWPDAPAGPRSRAAAPDVIQRPPVRADTAPPAALRRPDAVTAGRPVAAEDTDATGLLDHDHRSRHGRGGRRDRREQQSRPYAAALAGAEAGPAPAETSPRLTPDWRPEDQEQPAREVRRQQRTRPVREPKVARVPQTSPAGVSARTAPEAAAASAGPARSVATVETQSAPVTTPTSRSAAAKPRRRRRSRQRIIVVAAVGIGCAAAVGVGAKMLTSHGQPHTISAPSELGQFVEEPQLASKVDASALLRAIKGSGEASNVVDGVYAEKTGAAINSSSVIMWFVGGNLSGSAGSFIGSLTSAVPGAFVTSAGSMPGQAACIPGQAGHLSLCVWADNDTFGVVASPSLNTTALGAELRIIRPLVEHAKK